MNEPDRKVNKFLNPEKTHLQLFNVHFASFFET